MTGGVFHIALALVAGVAVGAASLYGLWVTTVKLPRAKRPLLLSLASSYARIAAVVLVCYALMDGGLASLAAVMFGYILARNVILRAAVSV